MTIHIPFIMLSVFVALILGVSFVHAADIEIVNETSVQSRITATADTGGNTAGTGERVERTRTGNAEVHVVSNVNGEVSEASDTDPIHAEVNYTYVDEPSDGGVTVVHTSVSAAAEPTPTSVQHDSEQVRSESVSSTNTTSSSMEVVGEVSLLPADTTHPAPFFVTTVGQLLVKAVSFISSFVAFL